MAERNPSDDQAAFGVFPQLKRNRAKQDREAAKNVPVDLMRGAVSGVLGAPGDIESLVRMLPYLDEKTVLPTSEDIEKRLPFKSETPVSRAATGLGQLAGGFYNGPGSPLRVIGALPSAVKHGAEEFAKASVAGAPHVVKPKGGNWLSGGVEKQLNRLKMSDKMTPEWYADRQRWLDEAIAKGDERAVNAIKQDVEVGKRNDAISDWIDSNLTNYVKKQMATPEDPVRKLAEEGVLHIQPYGDQYEVSRRLMNKRSGAGFPPLGMGKSEPARFWERQADISVEPYPAGSYKHGALDESILTDNPWLQNVPDETMVNYAKGLNDLGFDHIIDVLRQDVREGRIRPEQLNKVSMEQAVRRTYEYDQEMAKKMREAAIKNQEGFPLHKEYPEGYRWIELTTPNKLPEGYTLQPNTGYNKNEYPYKVFSPEGKELYAAKDEADAAKDLAGNHKLLEDALKYEGDTMGHCVGGYCPDVLEGRSRIFSLRDAKGEPHVTVETRPSGYVFSDIRRAVGDERANEMLERGLDLQAMAKEIGYTPPNEKIIQIKGKQNAKPKDEYLPYVQDFVRGGNWSDVGDFQNTGLAKLQENSDLAKWLKEKQIELPKYPTKQELNRHEADFLLEKLGQKEFDDLGFGYLKGEEGMKRGGVAISKNPDTMMLELGNQKMAGGGLAKLLRAAPKSKAEIEAIAQRMAPQMLGEFVRGDKGTQSVAGKTQKQFAKEKEMVHDIRPTGAERPLPKPVDIEQLKGNVVIGIPGDPTISGQTVHSIGGIPLDSPSPQHGGPLYGLGRDDAFWASGLNAANRVQNLAREAGMQYDAPVLGKYIMMGPESINYAQHYADANLAAINPAKMSKGQIESFNNLVREGYPYKKKGETFQRVFPAFPGIENPAEAYLHFSIDPELRKHFNALMQMPTVTEKHGLPSGIDVRHAITEPDLRDLETGVTGKSIGRMKPEVTKLGLSEHPTYSHDIPGEFMGSSNYPIPYEISFPDTLKSIRENPKQASHEFGTLKMIGPRQIIDQQMIDEIKQYEEQIKKLTGKKKGGQVHKAQGGAITGDDLIIEERPL